MTPVEARTSDGIQPFENTPEDLSSRRIDGKCDGLNRRDFTGLSAIEWQSPDLLPVRPVDVSLVHVDGQAPATLGGIQRREHLRLALADAKAMNTRAGPVEGLGLRVECERPNVCVFWLGQNLGITSIEIGAPDLRGQRIVTLRPVELPPLRIEFDRLDLPRCDLEKVFDIRAIEVCSLDSPSDLISPVDLSSPRIDGDAVELGWSGDLALRIDEHLE